MPTDPLGPQVFLEEHLFTRQVPRRLTESYLESTAQKLPRVIYPVMRTITADKQTRNYTRYRTDSLVGNPEEGTGLISFVRPYPIPIIRDHQASPGLTGRPASPVYGRVYKPAEFIRNLSEAYVQTTPSITDPEAIEGIMTGRWLTSSLGSTCNQIQCSICETELTQEGCEHEKGQAYETELGTLTALWDIGPIRAREQSFVVVPSDDQAGVLQVNLEESAGFSTGGLLQLYVGDERGTFELSTGRAVHHFDAIRLLESWSADSDRRSFSFRGFRPTVQESPMSNTPAPDSTAPAGPTTEEQALLKQIAERNVAEQYKGSGRYLLIGHKHDHEVQLNAKGDGTSTPGGTDGHTHGVVGGVVRVGGTAPEGEEDRYDWYGEKGPHTHYLEVAHAADERTQSGRSEQETVPMSATDPKTTGHAARLVDAQHGVDLHLYALPETCEQLTGVLQALAAMGHTPSERVAIQSVLARHCRESGGSLAEAAAQLTEAVATEGAAVVDVAITPENYALVYAALQTGAIARETAPAAPVETSPEPVVPEAAAPAHPVTEPDPHAPPSDWAEQLAAKTVETVELQKKLETFRSLATGDTSEALRLTEELVGVRAECDVARAETAALYMALLRKPLARNKSVGELAESLREKGGDALRYRLEFLREEFEAGGEESPLARLPRLTDPTAEEATAPVENEATDPDKIALQQEWANVPSQSVMLGETPHLIAFQLDEPEAEEIDGAAKLLFLEYGS